MRKLLVLFVFCLVSVISSSAAITSGANAPSAAPLTPASHQLVRRQPGIAFEPNVGQTPDSRIGASKIRQDTRFIARSGGYLARLNRGGVSLLFPHVGTTGATKGKKDHEATELDLNFRGANPQVAIAGEDKLRGVSDYFPTGDPKDWNTNVPNYGRVAYSALYPGIDLSFYGSEGRLEYDVDVAPGADPAQVQLALGGHTEGTLNAKGELVLKAGTTDSDVREMRLLKPVAYQMTADGQRQPVEAGYRMTSAGKAGAGKQTISFKLGKYDHSHPLVIDPVLVYGEFLTNAVAGVYGEIRAMAVDASGNAYLTGSSFNNGVGPYIQKLDSNGNVLFTVQVGNNSTDYQGVYPSALAVDSAGNISVAGYINFAYGATGIPTTSNAFQQTAPNGYIDAFVVSITASGTALTYCSYLDGTLSQSVANGIAVDSLGKLYVTGNSTASDFPTTTGAYAAATNSNYNFGFVAKFDPTLSGTASLVYSTAIPVPSVEVVENAIAVDSSGDAYVVGNVAGSGFATTPGAYTYNGTQAGQGGGGLFVTKLNPTGTALIFNANLGSASGNGIAVDGSGAAYVTGTVNYNDYPTTSGAWQTLYPAGFATKLNTGGATLAYSTFLNGPSGFAGLGITPDTIVIPPACQQNCVATIAGLTTATDLPLVNPIQNFGNVSGAGFIIQLAASGSNATFSTYLSGVVGDLASAPYALGPLGAVDGSGNIYFAANSGQTDLPLTTAIPANAGYGYLAKIGPASASVLQFVPGSVAFATQTVGFGTSNFVALPTAVLRNVGSQPASLNTPFTFTDPEFTETDNCGATLAPGGECTLNLNYTPTVSGTPSATLTASANHGATTTQLTVSGTATDGPFLAVSPTSVNFGDQVTGTRSTAQVVTLTNQGNQPYSLPNGVDIASQTNADGTTFPETNDCPAALNPKQSCQVSIVYAPSQLGQSTAILYPANLNITGNGIATGTSGSGSLSLSSPLINFGTLLEGTTSAPQYSFVYNTGTVPVSANGVIVTLTSPQGNASDFSAQLYDNTGYSGTTCSQMPPGVGNWAGTYATGCQVSVTFTPSIAGTETATISVADSTSASPHTFTVTGVGIAAAQTLESVPGNAVFDPQPVGYPSAVQTFYFYNTGTAPMTISRVLVTGDFQAAAENSYQECAGDTLQPQSNFTTYNNYYSGEYCSVPVTFTPTATGVRTGTLTLIDSATGSPQTFSLTGTGITPTGSITASPDGLEFGPQATGSTSGYQNVTITNTGNDPVTVNTVTLSTGYSLYNSSIYYCNNGNGYYLAPPVTLAAGQGCNVYIQFTPTLTSGTQTGTVAFGTSAGNTTVNLSGVAEAATQAANVYASTLSFGTQHGGTSAGTSYGEYGVWLVNTGTEPLTSSNPPAVTGNNDFAIFQAGYIAQGYPDCWYQIYYYRLTLQPGQTCYQPISYYAGKTAAETGTLTFTDSAGTQTVTLTATGSSTTPAVQPDPVTQNFAPTILGTNSQVTVNLDNNTANGLTILSATITAGSSDFLAATVASGNNTCTGQVDPGQSYCSVLVTFQPSALGLRTGTLTFKDQNSKTYTVSLTGYAVANVDLAQLDPNALAFLPQSVNAVSGNGLQAGQNVNLYNNGNQALTVGQLTGTDVAITTASASDFTINGNLAGGGADGCSGQTVSPGSICTVTVGFIPTTAGAKSGSLVFAVTYADNTKASLTATLTGSAYAEQDSASLTPTLATFLDQVAANPGNGMQSNTLTLTNTGSLSLNVGTLTGTDTIVGASTNGDFVATNATLFGQPIYGGDNCSGESLAPGGTCTVVVLFAPATVGAKTGSITFPVTYTDGKTASFTASLSGNGVAVANGPVLQPGGLVFAAEAEGVTDQNWQTITLVNQGNANFTVGTLSGTNFGGNNEFGIGANGCTAGTVLTPLQSCVVYVAFTPKYGSTRNGTLIFPITYPGATKAVNLTATLSGTGIAPGQEITPSEFTMSFPATQVTATSSQLALTFSNRGSTANTINSDSIGGTNSGDFAITNDYCTGASLGPNSSCSVYLTFTPAATGARTATLTETDSTTGSPHVIALKGVGIQTAALALYPTTLAFPQQIVDTGSAVQTIGVTNTGVVSTTLSKVSSSVPAEFAIVGDQCSGQTLAPASTCTIGVLFSPAATGNRTATLSFPASGVNSTTLAASGTGVTALSSTITLTSNTASAPAGSLFVLTATVKDANSNPLTVGSVNFFNGTTLLGNAQIVGTTTGGGVVGTAIYRTKFLPLGANSLTARYVGPDATGVAASTTVTVTGLYPSTTVLTSTGTQGNYALTATVSGAGPVNLTGNVQFNDGQSSTLLNTVPVALDPTTLNHTFIQGTPETFANGSGQPVIGDLNGDGIPDIVEGSLGELFVLIGSGDGTFQPAQTLPVNSQLNYVALGDFNGDGILDIAVTGNGSNILVFLGRGNGTFAEPSQYEVGGQTYGIVVEDFDGDGRLDLAVTDNMNAGVSVLLGNGDGSFQALATFATGVYPAYAASADVNGDGKLDLVVANANDSTVSVLLGNGNGTFQPQKTYPTGSQQDNYDDVVIGDVNGDGHPDIVVNNYNDGTVSVLVGSGTGTFIAQTPVTFGGNPTWVALGDMNLDGKLDIVEGDVSGSVSVALGNGNGTFQTPFQVGTGNGVADLAVSDFNGDGKSDIVFTNYGSSSGTSTVLLNTVTQTATLTGVTLPGVVSDIVTANYQGDAHYGSSTSNSVKLPSNPAHGVVSLAVTPASGPLGTIYTLTATVLDNNSNPLTAGAVTFKDGSNALVTLQLGSATSATPGVATYKTAAFTVGTHALTAFFTGTDSFLSSTSLTQSITVTGKNTTATLLTASGVEGSYLLTANVDGFGYGTPSGTVSFTDTTTATLLGSVPITTASSVSGFLPAVPYAAGTSPDQAVSVDLNNDGKLDLVVGDDSGALVTILIGNGDGTFTAGQSFGSGANYFLAVADVNSDGKPDVVVSNGSGIMVYLGNGDGTFQTASPPTVPISGTSEGFDFGDLNGDGKLDIVLIEENPATAFVLLGNGDGTFQTPQPYATGGTRAYVPVIRDFSGDGKMDLAVVNYNSGTVTLLTGNGDGTLNPAQIVATVANDGALSAADLNSDGMPDLIVTGNGVVNIVLNQGGGSFASPVPYALQSGNSNWAVVADVTRDGIVDIVASEANGNIAVLPGNGDGTFQSPVYYAAGGSDSNWVAVGDFNGDGRNDIASANYASPGSVSILIGTTTGAVSLPNVNLTGTGTDIITATYNGDPNFNGSLSNALPLAAMPFTTTTTLAATPTSGAIGTLVTLTATVADQNAKPVPGGQVAFYNGTQLLGTVGLASQPAGSNLAGTATLKLPGLPVGTNTITAQYLADATDGASTSSAQTVTITGQYSTKSYMTLNGTVGKYTLTDEVISYAPLLPSGPVNFTDVTGGNAILGTATLGGNYLNFTNSSSPSIGYSNNEPVVVGDFNGDGKSDLATCSSNSSVGILLGNGDGTFQAAAQTPAVNYCYSLLAGDFNRDGKLDLVSIDYSGTISVLLGNGDGTFGTSTSYPDAVGGNYGVLGDFNNDGKLDIVTTSNGGSQTAQILLGNGDGSFQAPVVINSPGNSGQPAAGDFNGDGKLDLAIPELGGTSFIVLLGNGDGTFGSPTPYAANSPGQIVAADLNRDGKLDLVVACFSCGSTGNVSVLIGNGDGTFQTLQAYNSVDAANSVAVADFNLDGYPDIVTATTYGTTHTVLLNHGDGTFPTSQSYNGDNAPGIGSVFVAIGDFNGDGRPDFASSVFTNIDVFLSETYSKATLTNVAVVGTGNHNVDAVYAGVAPFTGSTSNALPLATAPVTPGITLVAQPSSPSYGTPLNLQVTLFGPEGAPAPGGIVNYTVDGGASQQSSALSGGIVTLALGSALAKGPHSVVVTYPGNTLYLTTNATLAINVSNTGQTIAFPAIGNVTYGTPAFYLYATATSGLAVTYKVDSGPATITQGNVVTVTGAGTVTIEADQAGNSNYGVATPVLQSFTVAQATLAFTVKNATRVYGAANPAFTGTFAGLVNNDVLTPTYSTSATATSAYGTYPITATLAGAALPNYAVIITPGTLTVTKTVLTVTVANQSRQYGTVDPTFTGVITGLVNGDQVTAVYSATDTVATPVGNYPVITATLSGAALANYTPNIVNGTLSITKAPATIAVANASRTYGAANPTFTGVITGGLNGDALTAGYTTTATLTSPVGPYPIYATLTGSGSGNYTTTVVPGTLTVGTATLTVGVNSFTKVYGTANPALTGTISGLLNGDTVTAAYSTTATQFSYVVTGGYPITATISGSSASNYTASITPGTLTITPAILNLVENPVTRVYGTANPTFTGTLTGVLNNDPVSISYSTSATAGSGVGVYLISATLTGAAAGNYTLNVTPANLTVIPAPLTVTAASPASIYGSPLPAFTASITGFVNSDPSTVVSGTPSLTTTATAHSSIGQYTITAALGSLTAANYNFQFVNGTLTISPATLTVTAIGVTRIYGVPNPALTATITGFVAGDPASVVTGAASVTTSATLTSPVGSYSITAAQGTLLASNYNFAFVPAVLSITQATPVITWSAPASIYYGVALGAAELDATSTVPGTFVYTPGAGTKLAAGIYTLSTTFTPTDTTDYTSPTATITLTVNKATPAISWPTPAAISYGTALGATQLDASTSAPGTFAYLPAPGTVLTAGTHPLSVTFTPNDSTDFNPGTATVPITVNPATPSIVWPAPAAISYGTALSATQLDATSTVAGTFTYAPAAGAVLAAGTQTLTVTFTPTDTVDYNTVTTSVPLTVSRVTPTISWPTPASISYGTVLSAIQLNATSTVAGTFAYSPASGTLLTAGTYTLTAIFTPTDAIDYNTVTTTVPLAVSKVTPAITWAAPTAISYGTALGATQLNATANVAGAFVYSAAAGSVPTAGSQTLSVTFTPTDTTDYNTTTATVPLTVNQVTPIITWPTPTTISYGTALGSLQLNATTTVPGTFVYSPATGIVPTAGAHTLSVTFTPTDAVDYTSPSATVTLNVTQATPTITWPAPAGILYGTALSAAQLNATSPVAGTFAYSPAAGNVVAAGSHTLYVTFTPTDAIDYTTATYNVPLNVGKAVLTVTASNASRTYAAANPAFSATIAGYVAADASNVLSGSAALTTTATTTSPVGSYPINAALGSLAAANYSFTFVNATLTVTQATPAINWPDPAPISQGTALSATQLDATSTAAGTFVYTPAAGTKLAPGSYTLSVTLTPTDTTDYTIATATVPLTVNTVIQTTPVITWPAPAAISYLTPLGANQLDATTTVPGTFAYTPAAGTVLTAGSHTLSVTFTPSDTLHYSTANATVSLIVTQLTPVITWPNPANISYPAALSATQLDATTTVSGTFSYTPAAGTVLTVGSHTLLVTFTPTDTADYTTASATAPLTVIQGTPPAITWPAPAAISYGTALSATQLDATTTIPGTFAYTPAAGTVFAAGAHTLSVTFTPTDTTDYTTTNATVPINVNKANLSVAAINASRAYAAANPAFSDLINGYVNGDSTNVVTGIAAFTTTATAASTVGSYSITPAQGTLTAANYTFSFVAGTLTITQATPLVTWPAPASVAYHTALGATQLDATTTAAGTFVYTPAAGAILTPGTYTLSVAFTPSDTTDYTSASATVPFTVNQVNQTTPAITWPAPASVSYGTALSASQLDATATVAGTFTYTPAAGSLLTAGLHTLSVTFTPTDTIDYSTATASVPLTVNPIAPTVVWATPASVSYGTALSATQLDASSTVPGTFVYTQAAGTILTAGSHSLSVTFTPTDSTDYTAATSTVTLNVSQATPAITWPIPTAIPYGTAIGASQLDAATTVAGTFAYSPAADTVFATGAHTLSVTFTPTDTTDYTTATYSVSLSVTKALLTVTALNASRVYATANPTFADSITGYLNGDTLSVVSGAASFTSSATSASPVGSYPLTPALGTLSAANYAFTFVGGTLTVTQATPILTWPAPGAISYGTALSATQLDATSNAAGTFLYSPAAGTTLTPGSYTLSVTFTPTDTTDYTTATTTVPLTVNTVTQSKPAIFWPAPSAIAYGTPLSAAQLDATALVAGTFTYSPAAGAVLGAGAQTLLVTFTPTNTILYTSSTATVTLPVNKAVLTVLANNASRVYGAANPAFTSSITGFVNGDSANVVSGTAALATIATPASTVGSYPITATQGTLIAANYSFNFVGGTLTVTPATPVITWTAPAAIVYGKALSATQLDAKSAVAGTFIYAPQAGTILSAGPQTLSVTFTPTDTVDYTSASATVPFTVTPAPLTVSLFNNWRVYGMPNPSFNFTVTGLIGSDSVTFTPETIATPASPVGTYAITATVTGPEASNYAVTFRNGVLTVNKALLHVEASNANTIYGETPAQPTAFGVYGFVNGDTVSVLSGAPLLTTTVTSTTPAGKYPIAVQMGTLAATNYYFSNVSSGEGLMYVYKKPLLATASNLTIHQGDPIPTLTYSLSGFVNGDTATTAVTGAPVLSTTAKSTSAPGKYVITGTLGTLASPNYTFEPVNGTLTVLPPATPGAN